MEHDENPYKSNREVLDEIKAGLNDLNKRLNDTAKSITELEKWFAELITGKSMAEDAVLEKYRSRRRAD